MPDEAAYDTTTLDWKKIRAFAARVARETTMPQHPALTYTTRGSKRITSTGEEKRWFGLSSRPVTKTQTVRTHDEVEYLGPHWSLDERRWSRKTTVRSNGNVNEETLTEWITFGLLPDGTLVHAYRSNEEIVHNGALLVDEYSGSCREMSEYDVLALDRERRYTNRTSRPDRGVTVEVSSDRDAGRRLLYHAKGVGLSKRLKNVLEGRRD